MKKNKKKCVVAASVTGPYHLTKGWGCQDFFCYKQNKNSLIAVVSDGAGSAKYGKLGAKCVCETLCDVLKVDFHSDIKQQIIDAIDTARDHLMFHRLNKTKNENGLIDFAATLVGFVLEGSKGLFFHIGDGAGVALFKGKENHFIISEPENGIFSSETFFYTMDDWKDSLRFTPFHNADSLFLMTDGVTGFALKKNTRALEKGFLSPINDFLEAEKDEKKAKRALKNTLKTPKAQALSADDKTILWARLK